MNMAEAWDVRPDGSNPCRQVERNPERRRQRFLTMAELEAMGAALADLERAGTISPHAAAAIRLLALTGCRLNEILTARWDYVDFNSAVLRLPDSKTGAKTVHLPASALEILSRLPRIQGCPFVIAGQRPGAHLIDLKTPWNRVRLAASLRLWRDHDDADVSALVRGLPVENGGLPSVGFCHCAAREVGIELPAAMMNVRIHDLRHSFAAVGASSGMSLVILGGLLGHSQPSTTARYAHLSADPVAQAANVIGSRIDAAMTGRKGELVPLR
jgi:integrase